MIRRWLTFISLVSVSLACSSSAQTLVFTGDINLSRRQSTNWNNVFQAVQSALLGETVIGNLESPITDQPYQGKGIDLRAPLAAVAALQPFTHLSVENNHAQDGGIEGQRQNRLLLRDHGLQPVTAQPLFFKFGGKKVALLSFLDGPEGAPLNLVRAARKQAEEVIVLPHWGVEYDGVTSRQREEARALSDAGATLIVGTGPHVLQESERLGDTLVLYSLGNFLFDQPYASTWLGGVARVNLRNGKWTACLQSTYSRQGKIRLASTQEAHVATERTGLPLCRWWR